MRNDPSKKQVRAAAQNAEALPPPDLPGISITPEPLSRAPLSAIYRGWDRVHHYNVIVKVLHTTDDPVAADRFRREASVMAKIRHPSIVALYQFHDGNPASLVMEYVPGQTLEELIQANGRLEPAQAADIVEQIAAALDCIHAENIVHRDVKPSNILLPKHGPARLTDFGVAHIETASPLTIRGDMLGTIEYASPEQVQGTVAPDARSDVYSLAAVAYFALTGTPPFQAVDSSTQAQLSVMHQQVFSEPPPLRQHRLDLSMGIDAAVRRGLAKDPAGRYPSAGQFASALRSAVVASAGAPEQAAMAVITRRTAALTGALAGAALLVGGGVLIWSHEQSASLPLLQQAQSTAPAPQPAPLVLLPAPVPPARPRTLPQPAVIAAVPRPPVHVIPIANRPLSLHHASADAAPDKVMRHMASVRVAKRPVTERPRFRRHPALVAQAGVPVPPIRLRRLPRPGTAWLAVYARQSLGGGPQTAAIPASEVTVDGHPVPSLAKGGWASLPSGKHLIAYIPAGRTGFGRNPGLWVTLAPGAHLSRQVLLPFESAGEAHLATNVAAASVVSAPIQATPQAAAVQPAATVPASQPTGLAVGWYTVSGWIVRSAAAIKPTLIRTSAQWVKVDGQPILALALGQWAELTAGKHTITFQPTNGVGAAAKTWDIDLPPLGHLDQKIPLPSASSGSK